MTNVDGLCEAIENCFKRSHGVSLLSSIVPQAFGHPSFPSRGRITSNGKHHDVHTPYPRILKHIKKIKGYTCSSSHSFVPQNEISAEPGEPKTTCRSLGTPQNGCTFAQRGSHARHERDQITFCFGPCGEM
jgi:hypothetical protein